MVVQYATWAHQRPIYEIHSYECRLDCHMKKHNTHTAVVLQKQLHLQASSLVNRPFRFSFLLTLSEKMVQKVVSWRVHISTFLRTKTVQNKTVIWKFWMFGRTLLIFWCRSFIISQYHSFVIQSIVVTLSIVCKIVCCSVILVLFIGYYQFLLIFWMGYYCYIFSSTFSYTVMCFCHLF